MLDKIERSPSAPQTISELISALNEGKITAFDLTQACLEHIKAHDDDIQAWAFLDDDLALASAKAADEHRHHGNPLGPLHGIPIGIKDNIDTEQMPTELGTPIHKGRTPSEDAKLVSLLKEAGAVILGKTVTAEMAVLSPGKTRNPHNPAHTPGGSSSGSAAAVASSMVPVAIGSQTNGSVIRPASYCGVFGFKPSYGSISRHRVLQSSAPLDTIGIFANSLDDIAVVADTLIGFDANDRNMKMKSRPQITKISSEDPPIDPRFAFVRSPVWDLAEENTKDGFRELIEHLGGTIDLFDLPSIFNKAHDAHKILMEADIAKNYKKEYENSKDELSPVLIQIIERGQKQTAVEYNQALDLIAELRYILNDIFEDYDAIITPSAPGEAPKGIENTGDPSFCTIWSFCGTPALNLPILQGEQDLPIGVQLVGNYNDDARLLRTAKWLLHKLQ